MNRVGSARPWQRALDGRIAKIRMVNRAPVHQTRALTFLKLTGRWQGLPVGFSVTRIKDGIGRVIHSLALAPLRPGVSNS
jgi:hypothetical protein